MAFQSLNPHLTEVYAVTFTIFTPGQQVITRNKSNPLSKIMIKENVFPTLVYLVLKFEIFLYTWNKEVIIT